MTSRRRVNALVTGAAAMAAPPLRANTLNCWVLYPAP